MCKVLFLMRFPLEDAYNLKLKFVGQMHACSKLGYDVYYIGYDSQHYYLCSMSTDSKTIIGKTHCYEMRRYRNSIAFLDLYAALASALKRERFRYIYMRKKLVTASAVAAFKRYKRNGGKLIVEIPTYGAAEASLSRLRKLALRCFARSEARFEELVDLYVLIGENCPNTYKGKPAMEIINGVSLDDIPLRKSIELGTEIHMVALASMREWQGFDRIIRGMKNYNGNRQLILHLVGQDFDGSVKRWLELSDYLGVADSVLYHGALYGEQLTAMFDGCHMAVGSMGLHRKGMTIGSTLKVREYIARGIPFIYGYIDSLLSGNEWFALRINADDSDVDLEEVTKWLDGVYAKEDYIQQIKQFGSEEASWESQLSMVFRRIREV